MQTSKRTSNSICQPQSKDNVLNFLWLDNTSDNSIVIEKICERNLCSTEEAQVQLKEYHKFLYCLGKEYRLNELLQDQMLLFPSAIVSRIWRMHQLFTIEYPSLCRDLGFNFISFNPEKICFWSQTENQINKLKSSYEKTLELLKKEFKDELNEEIWPSNFNDMVKQHLLSFHINLTTYKSIENKINDLNGAINFSEMSISDIKNKVIPEIRKDLHQFKESKFELINPETQDKSTKEIYSKMNSLIFPQEMVSHIQNEYLLTPETTEYLIMEYKKFFMIFLVNNSFSQVPSAFVDEVWHTHINFAKIYAHSCKVLVGGFINHIPATNQKENEQEIMKEEFNQTMNLYQKLFGAVNEEYWQLKGEFRDDQQNFFWVDLYSLNKKSQAEALNNLNVKAQENTQLDDSISTQNASVNQDVENSCNGCDGSCNAVENLSIFADTKQNSCTGCDGDCFTQNILVASNKTEKKSCNGCDGSCNMKKASCNGCDGSCNMKSDNKAQTKSCNGCDGSCNMKTAQTKSCNGCDGSCNMKQAENKKSCNGCDGSCNMKQANSDAQTKSCNGCDGSCNMKKAENKTKSCNGCDGSCNMKQASCNGCDGSCNMKKQAENKKSCNGCDGSCNMKKADSDAQTKSCNGCDGNCNMKTAQTKSCNGCDGSCNMKKDLTKSCKGCDGSCNMMKQAESKKSCNGCDGSCNMKATKDDAAITKSCNGCDGNCNMKTAQTKSCNGCDGSCNMKSADNKAQKKSCNGCDGSCNMKKAQNKTQTKSCSGCDGNCNMKQASCNGCDGSCNMKKEKTQAKSCNGCDGSCNMKQASCNSCDGSCNMKKAQKKTETKSCNGCDGNCNMKQVSCNGCDGSCNMKKEKTQAKSCNGCDGSCNMKKSSCNDCDGSCNMKKDQKKTETKSCNGCDGNCNMKQASCNGCDGSCNMKKAANKGIKNSCDGCDGSCNSKQAEKKNMKSWSIDCLIQEGNKKKNQIHSNKMKIQQKLKMIQFCGDCFLISEKALNISKQNLAKIAQCAIKQNVQEEQEDSQKMRTEILEMVSGMNKVLVC